VSVQQGITFGHVPKQMTAFLALQCGGINRFGETDVEGVLLATTRAQPLPFFKIPFKLYSSESDHLVPAHGISSSAVLVIWLGDLSIRFVTA